MSSSDRHLQQFHVPFEYPVLFTESVFSDGNDVLAEALDVSGSGPRHRVMAFLDEGLVSANPSLPQEISCFFERHRERFELVAEPWVVTGGEAIKNDYRLLMQIVDGLLEFRMCRHSYVLAVGGGAVLDAVGFGAAIVHRGLRTVRLPTTVLAQCDAGIGVKNGMNLHGGKNTVGTFHPPFAVINDAAFLRTLSFEHWIGGVAEAFKVAIIKDAVFLDELCRDAERLRERDEACMHTVVHRCARMHLDHIALNGDPFELGAARPLDFGHWAAHKLESMTGYKVGHGQAVAIGIALDCTYAARQGWIEAEERDAILDGMQTCGLPLWHPALDRRIDGDRLEVLSGLEDFREHLGGVLCVTYPRPLGSKVDVNEIDRDAMTRACAELKARASVCR